MVEIKIVHKRATGVASLIGLEHSASLINALFY